MQFRFAGQHRVRAPEAPVAPEAEQAAVVGGQPRRELLLQLADGADRLHAVQPVDGHRPAEPARAAAHGVRLVVGHGCVQRHRVPAGRGRAVPHRLPGTGPDGVQYPEAGRPLRPIPVVPVRPGRAHAARPHPAENRRAPHTPVPPVHQGNVCMSTLMVIGAGKVGSGFRIPLPPLRNFQWHTNCAFKY